MLREILPMVSNVFGLHESVYGITSEDEDIYEILVDRFAGSGNDSLIDEDSIYKIILEGIEQMKESKDYMDHRAIDLATLEIPNFEDPDGWMEEMIIPFRDAILNAAKVLFRKVYVMGYAEGKLSEILKNGAK